MPEETELPSEPGRRRSRKDADDESGGGGKILIIILLVLLAGVIFAFYKRHTKANALAETDAKTIAMFSNQVAEIRTKVALEQSDYHLAQSNHQALLAHRTAELTVTSNRLVQTSLMLSNAQHELRSTQDNLGARIATVATLEARHDELARQAIMIPGLQRDIAELNEKLVQAQFAYVALEESFGRVRVEKADLERQLNDPAFLRLQMQKAEENAAVQKQMAAGGRIDASDPRVRLVLQPDGTVRPLVLSNSRPAK